MQSLLMLAIVLSSAVAALMLGLLLQNVFLVAVTAFAFRRGGVSLRAAGLARPSLRQIALGIGLGLGMAFAIHWFGVFELWALRHTLPLPTYHALETLTSRTGAENTFKELPSRGVMLLFALLGTTVAPIGEEVFFRGLVYNTLKSKLKKRLRVAPRGMKAETVAMIGSALLFALLHVSPLNLLPIFIMGLAFAYVYERTGSLWITILMHAINNGTVFVMLAWTLAAK
jgi:membrane protease YdiL (CAAX protease family)